MRDELLKFFASREEKVKLGGIECTVRSLPDEESVEGGPDLLYQLAVRCTFDADGGRVFADTDIEALKVSPRFRKAELLKIAARVNGLNADDEEKNSEADPSSG